MSEENTIRNLAEKIAKDFDLTIKERTDRLLQLDAIQYTNLGIDSLKAERTKVKTDSKFIYRMIQKVDEILGKSFIHTMDA
jgi:hypothetical protein|tara:strand:+ start:2581 stop:2823 length:243 start_codon:yes stop_codon:yes gene_type:complete